MFLAGILSRAGAGDNENHAPRLLRACRESVIGAAPDFALQYRLFLARAAARPKSLPGMGTAGLSHRPEHARGEIYYDNLR